MLNYRRSIILFFLGIISNFTLAQNLTESSWNAYLDAAIVRIRVLDTCACTHYRNIYSPKYNPHDFARLRKVQRVKIDSVISVNTGNDFIEEGYPR